VAGDGVPALFVDNLRNKPVTPERMCGGDRTLPQSNRKADSEPSRKLALLFIASLSRMNRLELEQESSLRRRRSLRNTYFAGTPLR